MGKRRRSSIQVEHIDEGEEPTLALASIVAIVPSQSASDAAGQPSHKRRASKLTGPPGSNSQRQAVSKSARGNDGEQSTTAEDLAEIQRLREEGILDSDSEDGREPTLVTKRGHLAARLDAGCEPDGIASAEQDAACAGNSETVSRDKGINDDVEELAEARRKEKELTTKRREERRATKRSEKKKARPQEKPPAGQPTDQAKAAAAAVAAREGVIAAGGDVGELWNETHAPPRAVLKAASERDGMTPRLMHPAEEMHRCQALAKLRQLLVALCRRHGVRKVPFGAFERWHFCWLLHCAGGRRDGLLPLIPRPGELCDVQNGEADVEAGDEDEGSVVSVTQEMARVLQEELQVSLPCA